MKLIRSLIFLLFAGFFCYAALLQSPWVINWIKESIQQQFNEKSGGAVLTIGQLRITLSLDVYSADLAIYSNGEKTSYAKEMQIIFSPKEWCQTGMLTPEFWVKDLVINQSDFSNRLLEVRGSLAYNTKTSAFAATMKAEQKNPSDSKFSASLVYKDNQGNVIVDIKNTLHWEEEFSYSDGKLSLETDLNLSELAHAFAIDSAALDGKAHLSLSYSNKRYRGEITIANGFIEIYSLGLKADTSGRVFIKGDGKGAVLGGDLTTSSLRIQLPKKPPALTNPLEVTHINSSPNPSKQKEKIQRKNFAFPLSFNIRIRVPSDGKLKNEHLNSRWKGDIVLQGSPRAPELFGEFKLEEGTYVFRGKSLKLSEGTITFGGIPDKKTSLYVIAEIEIDTKKFEAIVKGPILNLSLAFRSNPPLSQREILSWILFNQGTADISSFQGSELNLSLTKLSSGSYDGPDFLTRIGNIFGLDHVDINHTDKETDSAMSVKVGKYLNKNTLVSVSRKFSPSEIKSGPSSSLSLETKLWNNYKFQAEIDDHSNKKFNLLWKKDY